MLISVTLENIFSYDTATEFSMVAGKITKQHKNHVMKFCGLSVLRGAILYGPNASGKSNLLKAIRLLMTMLDKDSCLPAVGCWFKMVKKPRHDMAWVLLYSKDDEVFRYSIRTDGRRVLEEKLSRFTNEGEESLFDRHGLMVSIGDRFKSIGWYHERTFQATGFYLGKLVQDGLLDRQAEIAEAPLLVAAYRGLRSINVMSTGSIPTAQYMGMLLQTDFFRRFLKDLLVVADLGIEDVVWRKCSQREVAMIIEAFSSDKGTAAQDGVSFFRYHEAMFGVERKGNSTSVFELQFVHKGMPFHMSDESEGTVRLFRLSVMLFSLRNDERTWFVDEFDSRMHPFMTRKVLEEFMALEGSRSQLIVTAHDTSLMSHDIWRTDEVWFAEKRIDGSSDLYSLYQYTPRFDKNLQKGYLQGLYGAIPHFEGGMLNG